MSITPPSLIACRYDSQRATPACSNTNAADIFKKNDYKAICRNLPSRIQTRVRPVLQPTAKDTPAICFHNAADALRLSSCPVSVSVRPHGMRGSVHAWPLAWQVHAFAGSWNVWGRLRRSLGNSFRLVLEAGCLLVCHSALHRTSLHRTATRVTSGAVNQVLICCQEGRRQQSRGGRGGIEKD